MANKKWLSGLTKGWKCDVDRNTFSRSHRHYATYNYGKIYPVYARAMHANETVTITPGMVFDMVPTNHKIRNNVTAHVRAFNVPLRTLWKNWQPFSMQDKTKDSTDFVHPYLYRPGEVLNTPGSMLNHMGIPAVSHSKGEYWDFSPFLPWNLRYQSLNGNPMDISAVWPIACRDLDSQIQAPSNARLDPAGVQCPLPFVVKTDIQMQFSGYLSEFVSPIPAVLDNPLLIPSASPLPKQIVLDSNGRCRFSVDFVNMSSSWSASADSFKVLIYTGDCLLNSVLALNCTPYRVLSEFSVGSSVGVDMGEGIGMARTAYYRYKVDFVLTADNTMALNDLVASHNCFAAIVWLPATTHNPLCYSHCPLSVVPVYTTDEGDVHFKGLDITPGFINGFSWLCETDHVVSSDNRFDGADPDFRLSALFARAYRAVYNGYFRNRTVDPFCPAVNPHDESESTVPYVDRYVENMDDGADEDTPLELEYCRFDEDYYSGALPSPTMMNNRPLVGVTYQSGADNTATLRYVSSSDPTDTGTIDVYVDNSSGSAEGGKVTGISSHEGFDPSSFTIATLKDAIRVGINLDDLRNVQALTAWYQATYKAGRFSWGDFMAAHYGVSPKYDARLCPELLMACDMTLQEFEVINSASPASPDGAPLGAHGGLGKINGDCNRVKCFADEDSILLMVVYFTCNNAMTDAVNRQWYRALPSDYPATEFANLGMQPILRREVAPLLTANPMQIFAYQRVYGDLLESHDTVAGEFCRELADEVMVRRLTQEPELSQEFLSMTPEDFSNPYVEPVSADKFYGSWLFDEKTTIWLAQRPNQVIL